MRNDYKKFFKYLGKNRIKFILITLLSTLIHVPRTFIRAHSFKLLIDYFVYRQQDMLVDAIVIISIYLVISLFLIPFTHYLGSKMSEIIMRDIRISVFDRIKKLPVEYYDRKHSGDIMARVNRDISTIRGSMNIFNNTCFHILSVFLVIPYYIYLDYRLAIVVFITSIIAAFVNLKFVQPIRNQSRERNKKLSKLTQILTENITGFRIVKMFGLERFFSDKLNDGMDNIYGVEYEFVQTETKMVTLNNFAHSISYIAIAFLAGYLVITGELGAGSLVSAIMVSGNLAFHFLRVGQNIANIQRSFAGIDRVDEFYSEDDEKESYDTAGDNSLAGVSVKSGSFSYDGETDILKKIDIQIPKGKMAALVGDSGGGKSTLVKLILGHYELDSGQMTISCRPVCDYTLAELRRQTAYVPQDAYIFNGTIKENIMYGNSDASYEDILSASKKANAHEFILQQNSGYDTLVGERGIRLSGGQRQRIAIARAILKDAPILLLDEATSSLDSASELLVQNALDELMKDRTSLVVAHRLSTIKHADIIYFIKNGKVAEEGTHEELLMLDGLYARLYHTDFSPNLV